VPGLPDDAPPESTVSELAHTIESLRRSEKSFRALVESSPDGVVAHRDGVIRYANLAAAKLLLFEKPEDLVGQPVAELVHPDDRRQVAGRLAALAGGDASVPFTDERLLRRDGSVVVASIAGLSVHFDGEPMVAAILRDVTERRRLDRQMHQAERMASLGALAAGVAHEINNPLTYVILRLDILTSIATKAGRLVQRVSSSDRAGDDRDLVEIAGLLDELSGHVATAKEGAQRVRTIVQDLRVFAEADRDAPLPVDIHGPIELAAGMAHHQLKQRATLVRDFTTDAFVMASEGKLAQLFLHLLLNAVQSIPPGAPEKHCVTVRTRVEGDRVVASVEDTGAGIPNDHLARIFEPFFTTKPAGVGAGLGLSMCHGIVTSLGGTIQVETKSSLDSPTGSMFTISLPLAAAMLPSSHPPPSAQSLAWPPANVSGYN
jgi:PAS domain S-box-containing protein